MQQKPSVSIIGAGIAGLTSAIALQKIGIETEIFEAAPSILPLGAGLALGSNAMNGLNQLGLAEEVIHKGKLLASFTISDQKGRLIIKKESEEINSKYGLGNFAIHRADLHQVLLSKINPKLIHTGKRALATIQQGTRVKVSFQDGSEHITGYLIVADGIHSAIRKHLLPATQPSYAGYTCWRAIIDQADFNLKDACETWGSPGRFGFVPLANHQVYWFACINAPKESERMKKFKIADLQHFFRDFHEPIPQLLKCTKDENLIWNDILDLKPLHQYAFDKIVLIGDAAHATTPNLGQGACQAIEDAVILANEMQRCSNYEAAFKIFEQRRLERTHYIIRTSRLLGKVAQIENRFLAGFRNFFFKNLPSTMNDRQLQKLYEVDLS